LRSKSSNLRSENVYSHDEHARAVRLAQGNSRSAQAAAGLQGRLAGDDPAQTKRAERAFLRHCKSDGVFASHVVLAEIAWVLSAAYGMNRAAIHELLARLIRTRGIEVENLELVLAALERFERGKADFADYLIAETATSLGAELSTFDKRLAQEDGIRLL
jgi:predicted nucleic-acid-binding protein